MKNQKPYRYTKHSWFTSEKDELLKQITFARNALKFLAKHKAEFLAENFGFSCNIHTQVLKLYPESENCRIWSKGIKKKLSAAQIAKLFGKAGWTRQRESGTAEFAICWVKTVDEVKLCISKAERVEPHKITRPIVKL